MHTDAYRQIVYQSSEQFFRFFKFFFKNFFFGNVVDNGLNIGLAVIDKAGDISFYVPYASAFKLVPENGKII